MWTRPSFEQQRRDKLMSEENLHDLEKIQLKLCCLRLSKENESSF